MATLNRRSFVRAGAGAALGLGAVSAVSAKQATPSALNPAAATPAATVLTVGPLEDLRKQLKGALLLPGDAEYGPASEPANGRFRSVRPLAVAQCADEADIVTCIKWARANGVPPVARSGGHSEAGYSTTSGLLINAGRINQVTIDKSSGIAKAGGGALNQNMLNAMVNGAHYLPVGTCLAVGLGPLTLGGGIGYNAHSAGLTCDHLTATRIVTATGDVIDVDASQNSDLFWACRGGAGGNFGINTSFTYQMLKVPRQTVSYFRYDWRGAEDAGAALSAYHKLLQTAPPAFDTDGMAQAVPVGNGSPREAIDAFVRGQYIGPLDELRSLVAPLAAAAKPVNTTFQEFPWWDMQKMFASLDNPTTHSFGDYSRYADKPLPDSVMSKLIDLLVASPIRTETSNCSLWSLGWIGGEVMDSVGRTETAYVHRNMLTLLRATPNWDNDMPPAVENELLAWTDAMIATMTPSTPNESYENFTNRRIIDWQHQYYAENFDRLVDIKTKYDPTNTFNNFQSIPTRGMLSSMRTSPAATPTT